MAILKMVLNAILFYLLIDTYIYIYNFMHQEMKLFRDNTNLWSKYSFWKLTNYFSSLYAQVLPIIISYYHKCFQFY